MIYVNESCTNQVNVLFGSYTFTIYLRIKCMRNGLEFMFDLPGILEFC